MERSMTLPLPIITCHCQLDPITGFTKLFPQRQYIMTSESDHYHYIIDNRKSHPSDQNLTINTSVRCLSGEEIQLGLNTIPHSSSKSIPISNPYYESSMINNKTKNIKHEDDSLPLPPNSGTISNKAENTKNKTTQTQLSSKSSLQSKPMNYNDLYQIYLNCRKDHIEDHLSSSQLLNSYNNLINQPNNTMNTMNTIKYQKHYDYNPSHELPAEVLKRIFMFVSKNSDDFSSLMLVCRKWYQLGTLCRWRTLKLNLSKPWDAFYFFLASQQFPTTLHNSNYHNNNLLSILNNIYYSSFDPRVSINDGDEFIDFDLLPRCVEEINFTSSSPTTNLNFQKYLLNRLAERCSHLKRLTINQRALFWHLDKMVLLFIEKCPMLDYLSLVGQWYQPEKTLLSISYERPDLQVLRLRQVQFIHSDKLLQDTFNHFNHFQKLELNRVNINDSLLSAILFNNYRTLVKLKINHCISLFMNDWHPISEQYQFYGKNGNYDVNSSHRYTMNADVGTSSSYKLNETEHIETKPQYYIQFTQLTYLDFKGCHNLSNGFICAMLEKSPSLRHLRLHNIMDVDQQILEKILSHCPLLTSLSLSQCHSLSDNAIVDFLKKKNENISNADLTFLCLSNNILLTEITLEAIARYARQLTTIDISGFSLKYTSRNDYLIREILKNCSKLTNVIITSMKWNDFQKSMNDDINSNVVTMVNSNYSENESLFTPQNNDNDDNENHSSDSTEVNFSLYQIPNVFETSSPTNITTDYIFSNELLHYIFCRYTQNKNIFDTIF